ncbi:ZmpA/ZmpB/ZmpC family metallo-endopeptidase [Streptococcus pseudopneumoniae]|uniref:ZmpA/ZmpB/ZmpC family metallo-endopeptidase n=1 Tax=Streptococcus pseudopneumoniae TaxID=257758 RepID=UPI00110C2AE9|nr:ZmpA/ZmpB/ZmpC family metallo-endopeptidase [Streptococcus pseudopneumoniae]TMR66847.1 YSIRK-type signal peptide-containing protein [Streptococcus pseudopneumoniae]
MEEFQFERKQRFSLRKYAIGACSVLLGTSLFFAGMGAQPVQATETSSTLISSHYLDEQDLPEKLKSELQLFEENKIEVKEGKEYYFIYRKLATRLPETGLFSNDGMFILGAGLLLLSFTLIKRKRGASYFLVTVFAVGGWGASISALENLVELQPALVKRVEGQFLPSPERVQGYEFTGYYLVRDSSNKELTVDKVESPALSQKEESSEPQSKKIVPQTASHFSSTEDLVQSPQPSYAVEKIVEAPDEIVPIGPKEEVAGNPQGEQPKAENNSDYKTSPEEGVLNATVEKPELLVTTEEVAFQTIEQEDATLAKGQTKVVQEGVVGERTTYTEVTIVNGEKSSKVIENIITKEPVNKVIAVGTKEEVEPKSEESRPVQPEKTPIVENETEKKPADGIGQPGPGAEETPGTEATPGEKQTPDKPKAEPKQPEPAIPAVESGGEENQTHAPQGTESNQPSKETAETKDSEPAIPAVESGGEENQTHVQQGTESKPPSKETAETKDSEPATPAVESGREEDQSLAEQKGEEKQLENSVEGVKDVGESAPQGTESQPPSKVAAETKDSEPESPAMESGGEENQTLAPQGTESQPPSKVAAETKDSEPESPAMESGGEENQTLAPQGTESNHPSKATAETKDSEPASPAVESGGEENQTHAPQGTESKQPSKETAETKDSEPESPAMESGGEENQTLAQQDTESNQPSKETAETKDSEPATPAVESGREEDQSPAEQKGEENQLENPVEGVKDVGESAPQETQKQPEQTAPSPEVNPSQGNEPESAVQPEPLSPQEQSDSQVQPTVPSPVTKEKVLEYKTTYKASPALNYKEQRVEVAGENGKEVTTTSYSFDESTRKIVENTSTKIEKHPVDRVVKVGNVEETTSTTKRGEQFVADESLDKGVKEVRNQGQDEETTTIKVYKVNEQTGDLTEPDVTTKVAKPMQAKITAVGTKSKVEIKDTPFETRYVADETLSYKEKVETPGEKGRTVSTTTYTVNQETGAISEETTTENTPAKDKIVKVGNVEKIVSPIEITELRKDNPELPKGKEEVEDAGEQGETTVTKTYEVNPETGELTNPIEKTEITKAMRQKVILVGTKEDTQIPQTKVETKAVPYETIYEKNEALDHGVTRVKISGVEGQEQVTTTYTKDQASGNISESKTVKIVANKVDQVVEVGTKPSVETTVLSHKMIYQVNPALEFRKEEVAVAGRDGSVETRTTYQLDQATGQVTVSDTTRQVNPAVDKVIQVGNVEKVIQPIAVTEERREDSSLAKKMEKVASEGEVGENTLTRTYAINEQTGELVNPREVSQITKPMKPRVVLVGSQEDKPHILPTNSEREDAVDVSALTTSARSVDFLHDSKLKAQLEPTYDPRDIITRRIALRKTHPNITDQEVKDMLRIEYLQKLSIQESFDQTKRQAESSFKKIASHTLGIIGDTPENRSKVKQELEQYKEQILLGLSYINRFYNIQFGDTNIRDILAFNPSSFGNKTMTALDSLKKLGSMSYEEMKLTNSPQTFTKYLSTITGKASLKEFLDSNRQLFTSDDADTWLKKSSQAMIVEKPSKENPSAHVGLYSKLTAGEKDPRKQEANMAAILGLLNVKEPNVYVISNMATITYGNIGSYIDTSLAQSNPTKYQAELARVKSLIEKAAVQQANYVDTLYRITKPENRDKLLTNRLIIDTMKKYTSNPNAQIDSTWSPATGSGADKGVDQFMTPMNYYSPVSKVGAEANGLGVRYFIDRVLDDRGSATYSHEMTHLLDRTVLFNNHGRRDGTAAEFYARGIFENSYNPEKDTYFNLNFVYDESDKDGFYNKTPDRFKTAEDLQSYMKGSFDVLYTLDYLEAEATKNLTDEEKTKYFKKIVPISSPFRRWIDYRNTAVKPTHKSEEIQALTLEDAKKLTGIDSLIDNHILVNRYIIAGFKDKDKIAPNGYYTVDMFDTIYGVSQNDSGMSGDITFRKQAFELMAALGYYEGFVPYVSNQYKHEAEAENKPLSDTYIFNKILNGKSYAEFKKAQFKERVDKIDQLKHLTIQYEGQQISLTSQKLKELMQKAVQEELKQIKAGKTTASTYSFIETPVQKLKKAIYKAYLKDSDDFRQSIYNS